MNASPVSSTWFRAVQTQYPRRDADLAAAKQDIEETLVALDMARPGQSWRADGGDRGGETEGMGRRGTRR